MIIPEQVLTARDDGFHKPLSPDDLWWTETCYFSFDMAGDRPFSLAVYPLFRPNMGICSLAVHLWSNDGSLPWEIPYSRMRWHLPMPDGDLTDVTFDGLTYRVLEPLKRYLVAFDDPGRLTMELEFEGIDPPYACWTQVDAESQTGGRGHFDQDCRVTGEIVIAGERIPVRTFGHRDRSWYTRPDNRPRRSASLSFGVSETEQFCYLVPQTVGTDVTTAKEADGGYLVRDGVRAPIASGRRRVIEEIDGRPLRLEVELVDTLGRRLEASGRSNSHFAFNCSPPIFAWFSQFEWTTASQSYLGEDQKAFGFAEMRSITTRARLAGAA